MISATVLVGAATALASLAGCSKQHTMTAAESEAAAQQQVQEETQHRDYYINKYGNPRSNNDSQASAQDEAQRAQYYQSHYGSQTGR